MKRDFSSGSQKAERCVAFSLALVIEPVLSHGVPAELWLEFPEFEVVKLIILARVLWAVCVVGSTCLHQSKSGAVGTAG